MSWIQIIDYKEANPSLKRIYDKIKGPDNTIDNVMLVHSLRPHTLTGHMTLYKNVLHNANNTLPKWYLEALGVYVSYLNQCEYCFEHHFEGFKKIFPEPEKSEDFKNSVEQNTLDSFFDAKFLAGSEYALALTEDSKKITRKDIQDLRDAGFTDGEILEINQVVSYFNYVNRTVNGLGVDTQGDILGLSPSDGSDPDSWSHQ